MGGSLQGALRHDGPRAEVYPAVPCGARATPLHMAPERSRRATLLALGLAPWLLASPRDGRAANAWQGYADNLVGSGKLSGAAILSHAGDVWSQKSMGLLVEEGKRLAAAFKDPSYVRANGLSVNRINYMPLGMDSESIKAKRTGGGVIAFKTHQTIVVGVYTAPTQPGDALVQVEKMADYLRNSNY